MRKVPEKRKEGSRNRVKESCWVGNWTSEHDLIIDPKLLFYPLSLSPSIYIHFLRPAHLFLLSWESATRSKVSKLSVAASNVDVSLSLLFPSPTFTQHFKVLSSGYGSEKRNGWRGSFNPRVVTLLLFHSFFPLFLRSLLPIPCHPSQA